MFVGSLSWFVLPGDAIVCAKEGWKEDLRGFEGDEILHSRQHSLIVSKPTKEEEKWSRKRKSEGKELAGEEEKMKRSSSERRKQGRIHGIRCVLARTDRSYSQKRHFFKISTRV